VIIAMTTRGTSPLARVIIVVIFPMLAWHQTRRRVACRSRNQKITQERGDRGQLRDAPQLVATAGTPLGPS
jgi:hypothetical protein